MARSPCSTATTAAAVSALEEALSGVGRLPDDFGREILGENLYIETPAAHGQLVELQLGLAYEGVGDLNRAADSWRAASIPPEDAAYVGVDHAIKARGQVGRLYLGHEWYDEAAKWLQSAIDLEVETNGPPASLDDPTLLVFGPLHGAEHNNLALAQAKAGDPDLAVLSAEQAVGRDPFSPIYADTLAFSHQLAGDSDAAIAAYRDVLDTDPTSYTSANNLAVLLADDGQEAEARSLLEAAIAEKPDYAMAWHNLGVLETRRTSPVAFLRGQGDLGKSVRLDGDLRSADPELTMDTVVYDSGIDVSRPVPVEWTYSSSAERSHRGFAITVLLLLLLRVAWTLGLDRSAGWITEKVLASGSPGGSRTTWFWGRLRVRFALAVTAIVLLVPGLLQMGTDSLWGAVAPRRRRLRTRAAAPRCTSGPRRQPALAALRLDTSPGRRLRRASPRSDLRALPGPRRPSAAHLARPVGSVRGRGVGRSHPARDGAGHGGSSGAGTGHPGRCPRRLPSHAGATFRRLQVDRPHRPARRSDSRDGRLARVRLELGLRGVPGPVVTLGRVGRPGRGVLSRYGAVQASSQRDPS